MSGTFFALAAALFWAVATRLYRQMADYWTPVGLATVKSTVSVILFGIWFAAAGIPFWAHDWQTLLWLLGSGVIGIALGDSALFYALYRMGERQTLLIAETAAPILVAVSAFVLLSETLTLRQIGGITLIVIGIDWVVGIRRGRQHYDFAGVLWALLAASCQAFGMVVSRTFLTQTDISAEETAFWRLLGASLVLPVWLIVSRQKFLPAKALTVQVGLRLILAIILGTFLGILFLQISVDLLPAGLAQALIATSILFATAIAALRGDGVDPRQWPGVVLSVIGVALVVV